MSIVDSLWKMHQEWGSGLSEKNVEYCRKAPLLGEEDVLFVNCVENDVYSMPWKDGPVSMALKVIHLRFFWEGIFLKNPYLLQSNPKNGFFVVIESPSCHKILVPHMKEK